MARSVLSLWGTPQRPRVYPAPAPVAVSAFASVGIEAVGGTIATTTVPFAALTRSVRTHTSAYETVRNMMIIDVPIENIFYVGTSPRVFYVLGDNPRVFHVAPESRSLRVTG